MKSFFYLKYVQSNRLKKYKSNTLFSKGKQMTKTDESLRDSPNLNQLSVNRSYLNI